MRKGQTVKTPTGRKSKIRLIDSMGIESNRPEAELENGWVYPIEELEPIIDFEWIRFGGDNSGVYGCDECGNDEYEVFIQSPSDHSGLRICGDCATELSENIDDKI